MQYNIEAIAKMIDHSLLHPTMTEEDLRSWETVLTEFNDDYGKILPIRATIRVVQKKSPFKKSFKINTKTTNNTQ